MDKTAKVYIAGHRGMVGSAIKKKLEQEGFSRIIGRSRKELDLRDQQAVARFFNEEKPDFVFVAAATVGGIKANDTRSADFIYNNLMIAGNVVHCSYVHGVKKLLFLGSSCAYPKLAPQPIAERHLLTGSLEPTNKAYALAKIAGITLCQMYRKQYGTDFISAMPTNLYGPNDRYDADRSHVIPALIRRFHEAKTAGLDSVTCWGTGKPKREFLYVEDLAEACLTLMQHYSSDEPVNIGTGIDISIAELAHKIAETVGFDGSISWDTSLPDGTPRKLLDISKITALGWCHKTRLENGLRLTYEDFVKRSSVAAQ